MQSYGNIGQPVYQPPMPAKPRRSPASAFLLLVVILLIGFIVVLFMNPSLVMRINTTVKGTTYQYDFTNLIGEQNPQVVQVVDPIKVQQDNPESGLFYRDSQKDDVVLIYDKLGIAVLYRPSSRKIINITAIEAGN